MKAAHAEWKVHWHSPIQVVSESVWRVEGSLPKVPLRRVMTVVRMRDGNLVIHNGIAVDDETRAKIEAWGRPRWLIVPNGYHRLDAPAFKARYPELTVLCPPAARKKVEEVIAVDGTYEDFPSSDEVRLQTLDGVAGREGVLIARDPQGTTVVFNDLIFNHPHVSGLFGSVYRMFRQSGCVKITAIGRLLLVKDKRAVAAHLRRLADEPNLKAVIVSHVEPILSRPAEELRRLAHGLDGN